MRRVGWVRQTPADLSWGVQQRSRSARLGERNELDIRGLSAEGNRPASGTEKYEICLSSGLLATPKCFETTPDKNSGETVSHRTTYFEIGTDDQAPKQTCNIHGEGGPNLVKTDAGRQEGEWPRAALAVDLASVQPVSIKAPTVVGADDPYGSVKPVTPLAKAPTAPIDNATAPARRAEPNRKQEVEVRRAERAGPTDQPPADSTIQIDPPEPVQF